MRSRLRAVPLISRVIGIAALTAFSGVAYTSAQATSTGPTVWPMFHHDAMRHGVTFDSAVNTTSAAGLHVAWRADLQNQSWSSPAVAYDSASGRTLVFVGTQANGSVPGAITAFNADTGQQVWKYPTGGDALSSPAVSGGVLYTGTGNHHMVAIRAATGQRICQFTSPGRMTSSPVVVWMSGIGHVVYIGDNGLTGDVDPGNFWAIRGEDCTLLWRFNAWGNPPGSTASQTGMYDQPAYVTSKSGEPLVVFGSTDPDDAVYALDARTGTTVWRFQTRVGIDTDVGAGPTISAPGVNGFADGVVYITGKDRMTYAINLTTGAEIWHFDIKADVPGNSGESQSVAALVGRNLYLGWGGGVYDLDAVTGAKIWRVDGLPPVLASPAVTGPAGHQVIVVGDTGGALHVYDLNGHSLYSNTYGVTYSSPAVADGKVFFSTVDTHSLFALTP